MNTAVNRWNSATASGDEAKLDAAASNFGKTATSLRKLATSTGDPGFSTAINAVAKALDDMQDSWEKDKKVSTTTYNNSARAVRNYCSNALK